MTSRYQSCKISGSQEHGAKEGRQRWQREWPKSSRKNNNFARASCFFVHFLAVFARLRHET